MRESDLKRKVLKFLKATYPEAWIYAPSDKFYSGIPDILMLDMRHLIAIELKIEGKKAEPIQSYVLRQIKKAGGAGAVCHSLEEVKVFLGAEHYL